MGSFEKSAAVIGGVLEVAGIEGFMTGTSAWLDESDPDTKAGPSTWRRSDAFRRQRVHRGRWSGG